MSDSPELVVAPNKLESFLPLLGVEVTENSKLCDIDTQEILTNDNGDELTTGEIGYLASDDDGSVKPVRDNFSDIVGELSDRDIHD